MRILKGVKPKYEEFHRLQILDEAVEAAARLSTRYIHDRFLPDKAIDLVDRACSQKRLENCIGLEGACALPKRRVTKLLQDEKNSETYRPLQVAAEDIAKVVSDWAQIPVGRLTRSDPKRYAGSQEQASHLE